MITNHPIVRVWWIAAVLLSLTAPAALAAPGSYRAARFDVSARAVGGGLDVTETITYEFQSGTFTRTWREIPVSRTDGITILDAAMDGVALTRGDGPGRYAVIEGNGKVRVQWRFAEVGPSVHRFDLRYRAEGVVYRDGSNDVVRWRAIPSERNYYINASRIQFEPAAGADLMPLETRRVGSIALASSNEAVTIDASNIRPDGWVIAELRYPAGQLIVTDPQWRQVQVHAREMAPTWGIGAVAILVAGLFLVIMTRQGYAPASPPADDMIITQPPQALPAALAAVLTARGAVSGYQAVATLLDLADRGVLQVHEQPGAFGRTYELSQVPGGHDLSPHEAEALSIAFADSGDNVTLSKARGRLVRQSRRFSAAVNAELAERGFIDPDRKAARGRLMRLGRVMIVVAVLGAAGLAPLIPTYRGWPQLLPLGLLVAGFVSLIMGASITPLSDEGLVEAARWRGFRRHLKTLSARDAAGGAHLPSRWIVYAIGAGLGMQLSRHLRRHPEAAPPWFVPAAAGSADSGDAFAAFVGSHAAASADGGGGAAGGAAAAGGGGSGAG